MLKQEQDESCNQVNWSRITAIYKYSQANLPHQAGSCRSGVIACRADKSLRPARLILQLCKCQIRRVFKVRRDSLPC